MGRRFESCRAHHPIISLSADFSNWGRRFLKVSATTDCRFELIK
jgi:hypothetical protein